MADSVDVALPLGDQLSEKEAQSSVQAVSLAPPKASVDTWPYAVGFATDDEQHLPLELRLTGVIPAYAAGTLFRTGPGNYKLFKEDGSKLFEAQHWFDGFTTTHRFHIAESESEHAVKVYYNSRRTCDGLVQSIRETGKFKNFGFAQKIDPCQSFFKKAMSSYQALTRKADPSYKKTQNVGVTLTANMPGLKPAGATHKDGSIDSLITKTDANIYQRLDPETLEPAGICNQEILHPELTGQLSAAHAKTCPLTGNVYNYNLEVSATPKYRIFEANASTGKTEILATVAAKPAYLHSLFITQSTVVFCVWGSNYKLAGVSLVYNLNILDSIAPTDPNLPATWYVVDRSPARRGLIATYTSPTFFCFHTVNAYEEPSATKPGEIDIIADLSQYEDLSILHKFYYKNLVFDGCDVPKFKDLKLNSRPHLARYRLPNVPIDAQRHKTSASFKLLPSPSKSPQKAEVLFTAPYGVSAELPTHNPRVSTLPHRYIYGVMDTGNSNFFDGLVKFDTNTQTSLHWAEQAQTAGEPIFVPKPLPQDGEPALAEDDGVLLSVVLDGNEGKSYLLCLDAVTMKEMGRASMDSVVGFGFHGIHLPKKKADSEKYTGGD